jgi:three-Cys-motif partner protein
VLLKAPQSLAGTTGSFEAKSWTPLKLVCLDWYLPIYFANLRHLYDRLVFVDLFSGAGISCIEESQRSFAIPGTTLLAAKGVVTHQDQVPQRFDEILAVDTSFENLSTLKAVLEPEGYRPDENFFTHCGEAEDALPWILEHISPARTHALVLSDPEQLRPALSFFQKLVRRHPATDLAVLHLVSGGGRLAGIDPTPESAIQAFYGGGVTGQLGREELSTLYEDRLSKIRSRGGTMVSKVRIHGGGRAASYFYEFLFAVRQTRGGSPWAMVSFADLESRIRLFDGEDVRRALRTRAGAQRVLESFPDAGASSGSG